VTAYPRFHFLEGPKEILRILGNFLVFFYHFFSLSLLAQTLFSPWKRIYVVKTTPGFSFSEWFNRLTFNLISSVLGAVIRLSVITIGILVETVAGVVGVVGVIVWLVLPVVSLGVYWRRRGKRGEKGGEARLEQFLRLRFAGIPLATISVEDKEEVSRWFERGEGARRARSRFWELENLLSVPGIGKDWAAGYTVNLDQYVVDLGTPRYYWSHLVGRRKEAEKIEQILAGATGRGCLLVGEPGVGKQTMVENFARKSKEGRTLPSLEQKRVLLLSLTSILGEAKSKEEGKQKVLAVFAEASGAGNCILVIDNFDQFVTSQEGRLDLTSVFVQAMEQGGLAVIGLTTPENFQKYIFPNKEILNFFEKIEVAAPTAEEALIILEDILPYFEKKTGVAATFPALKEIIRLAERWVVDIPFPEKAIELLDDCLTSSSGRPYLYPEQVRQVLTEKTKIPLAELSGPERERIANLEEFLHRRIVDQEQAIAEIAKAVRRRHSGVAAGGRPMGAFLFLGPTGVGKTETAKALAEIFFGSPGRMIRLDMAQFQEEGEERLIGSAARREPGILTTAVRQQPYGVLLLDELEKASLQIQNLFLTVLDEGYLTDAFGKKVSFENLLIIGTSNAGAEFIREKFVNNAPDIPDLPDSPDLSSDLVDFILRQGFFSPEFLNRFDAVIVYKPLSFKELVQIARLQLEALNQRLAEKKISLEISQELVEKIARLGFDPVFGARPMKRVIADKVEDPIAQKLLKGEVKRGEKIRIEI
jgi:ATP-dependent Clp protease ATP-binding subunit ClpC